MLFHHRRNVLPSLGGKSPGKDLGGGGGGRMRKRSKTSSKIIENLDAEHLEM